MKEQFRIIDSRDIPWVVVEPSLNELGENPNVAREFREKYPDLSFSQACLVDGNVLVQDVKPQSRRLVH